jgi:hypothetical protein
MLLFCDLIEDYG